MDRRYKPFFCLVLLVLSSACLGSDSGTTTTASPTSQPLVTTNPQTTLPPETTQAPVLTQPPTTPPPTTPPPMVVTDKIKVASFKIEGFDERKAVKPDIMETLSKIARNFDVIAIQEIRDSKDIAMQNYIDQINAMDGPMYDFIISPRLGRYEPKEQYAFLYNTETISPVGSPITYQEAGKDIFNREPFIASFKVKENGFDFVLINFITHTEKSASEIEALPEVIDYARQSFSEEEDFIVLGHLRADCQYFDVQGPSALISNEYIWLIDNTLDTTIRTDDCTFDRIIITQGVSGDYANEADVFRFDTEYGLTYTPTARVSSHYPVYAEFWTDKDTD